MLNSLRFSPRSHLLRFFCKSSASGMERYKEAFARRMASAGLKPHHRIALGVSGGPDSMALCVMTAGWKLDGLIERDEGLKFIDGLLAIVVDHRLRAESAEEAILVRERAAKMGIKCEIRCCDWSEGRPKQGHLQEAAREKRYEIFQDICMEKQIGVLLIAHHADDQAELLILRLSRNSGVLGLAGMPFTSQLFPTNLHYPGGNWGTNGILMVRPLLEFGKDDMYKICQGAHEPFVEDPTNQSKLFARNRIRLSLRRLPSGVFRSEIQMLISVCRLTRSFVESACFKMIKENVDVMDHGYAIIDVEKLEPSNVDDLCLLKFLSMVLQFISQRHRPVRGGTMQLLLDYIRAVPCKTSLTVAGCYISPAPRSKGLKVLVSCSVGSPQSSRMRLSYTYPLLEQQPLFVREVDEIIMDAKSYSDQSISDHSGVPFLHSKSSKSFLAEAKKLDLISESTLASILSLQTEEAKNFNLKAEVHTDNNLNYKMKSGNATNIEIYPGLSCHFMSRFLVTWKLFEDVSNNQIASSLGGSHLSREDDDSHRCSFCTINLERVLVIRHMVDSDWLHLAKVSESNEVKEHQHHVDCSKCKLKQNELVEDLCTPYMQLSAQRALRALKSIPVSVRKALPVLVDSQDLPVSIPSIGFKRCPYLIVAVVFKPRIPLGGGYASYI